MELGKGGTDEKLLFVPLSPPPSYSIDDEEVAKNIFIAPVEGRRGGVRDNFFSSPPCADYVRTPARLLPFVI